MRISDPRPTEAVILDLDGTLVDSEPLYRIADQAFFRTHHLSVPDVVSDELVGMNNRLVIDLIKERYGLRGGTDDLVAEKDEVYLAVATGKTRAFPRVRELVLALLLRGIKLAVATSSSRRVLSTVLDEIGLAAAFPVAVTSDDVSEPKPSPEVFLKAAERLGVAPERCWVIEDSQYGVRAAAAAGMRVIAVPALGHESLEAFGVADLLVTGGSAALEPRRVLAAIQREASDLPTIEQFRRLIYDHFRRRRREMPWRDTADPYRILVSEIMLQQTQAERVIPKYLEFLAAFPTVHDLAAATFQEVLSHWHGLGYNRRARYLHDAARTLVDDHGGVVPSTTADLRSLPGVGTYTAGAIRAFAFNLPAVFVETNIRRVFLQVFFPSHSSVTDRKLLSLVGATLDVTNPRSWYYALMDYGAYLASEFANANHRSAHYRPQTPFAGSVREVRGRIIRVLTQDGELERSELERRVAPGDQRFAVAVDGLVADRMIRVVGELVGLS